MKTIEMNQYAIMVFAFIIAGIGSLLPAVFGVPAFMAGLVYLTSSVALWTTFKKRNKLYYKIIEVKNV